MSAVRDAAGRYRTGRKPGEVSETPGRSGRAAAHAGTFYPATRADLVALVDRLLADAVLRVPAIDPDTIVGALTPHAGLDYSGEVAAIAWAAIARARPTTIVLLGADHWGRASGVAVWTGGPWRSPAGDIAIDHGLAERIVALGPPFVADVAAHLDEHSVEVQLPFVARAPEGARIVPLLIGGRAAGVAEAAGTQLGRALAGLRVAGEAAVVVASSDLSHYPPLRIARETDARVLEPILRLDGPGLLRVETDIRSSDTPGLSCGVCGLEAIRCVLAAAREMGATHGRLLAEATSAERAASDPDRTVGYAAVAFVG
jgi:AmmeMemoRadiSam system protein B